MFKILLLLCLLTVNVETVVQAEESIKCFVNAGGDILYSSCKCPEGYFEVDGLLSLARVEPRGEKEYTPIVPVESTAGVALFEKESQPDVSHESVIYHDKDGNLTMVFNDGLSHGQEWGYFNRRYYGLYRCRPLLHDHYSCCNGSGLFAGAHFYSPY